jgi:cyclase
MSLAHSSVRPRVIPCLLLKDRSLVKTQQFKSPRYIGDPINTVRIFNELETDELILLDITATSSGAPPQYKLIEELASECFMPLCYGGGVRSVDQMATRYKSGGEKVSINNAALERPTLISEAAARFGSQSVVVSIDTVKKRLGRGHEVSAQGGSRRTGRDVVEWARAAAAAGAGELLINSVDRDGTMAGYDLDLLRDITRAVDIPVVACGGAGTLMDVRAAIQDAGAQGAAAGSLFVYQGRNRSVLVNFPTKQEREAALPQGAR